MAFDPFKLESGLLGNVDVEVLDAEFLNDPAYNNGQTLQLSLTMKVAGDDGGERVENFSCGDGWETTDGGKTAVREDGREMNFTGSSKVGLLFKGLVGVMAEDKDADKAIRARVDEHPLGPRDAAFWKGLSFHIDRIEHSYGGDIGTKEVLTIDGFNGVSGSATKATGTAKKATKAAKKAPAKKAEPEGIDPAVLAQLDAIADDSGDHDEFMEKALVELDATLLTDEVKNAIADANEEGDGIWARAWARWQAAKAKGEV